MTHTAESYCARAAAFRLALARPVYFSGVPSECDACGRPLADGRYFADCELAGQGAWGCLCPTCIATDKVRFAWGRGQLYQRMDAGEAGPAEPAWLLVAGFAPADVMDETMA